MPNNDTKTTTNLFHTLSKKIQYKFWLRSNFILAFIGNVVFYKKDKLTYVSIYISWSFSIRVIGVHFQNLIFLLIIHPLLIPT